MSMIATNKQGAPPPFCGLQALQWRLKTIATTTADLQKFDAIYSVVEELYRLEGVLERLRYDRRLFDENDIDLALDRLIRGPEGGA